MNTEVLPNYIMSWRFDEKTSNYKAVLKRYNYGKTNKRSAPNTSHSLSL
jgi:hypothetical protein